MLDFTQAAKADIASAISQIECDPSGAAVTDLLDRAWAVQSGRSLGLTGPPGVGKSSLTQALVETWAAQGLTVAVLAIDPSSKRSGGALLGDRTRMQFTHLSEQVFTRSMAAGARLGGLSDAVFPVMVLLRAIFDRVLIETVGVGQSETEISCVADKVALCIQPGSGDILQFMKSGIAEVPDIVLVTKADLGRAARRAFADMRGALSLNVTGQANTPVLLVSAKTGEGVEDAGTQIDDALQETSAVQRAAQLAHYQLQSVQEAFGREGLKLAQQALETPGTAPFSKISGLLSRFSVRLADEEKRRGD